MITLEPGISTAHTTQMAGYNLSLIVPTSIQESYTIAHRAWLWSVTSFVAFVSSHPPSPLLLSSLLLPLAL
ncbi:type II restriction endonuclease, partial [Rhizobium ruizarguesonis]